MYNVFYSAPKGSDFVILGETGSGKTTFIEQYIGKHISGSNKEIILLLSLEQSYHIFTKDFLTENIVIQVDPSRITFEEFKNWFSEDPFCEKFNFVVFNGDGFNYSEYEDFFSYDVREKKRDLTIIREIRVIKDFDKTQELHLEYLPNKRILNKYSNFIKVRRVENSWFTNILNKFLKKNQYITFEAVLLKSRGYNTLNKNLHVTRYKILKQI